MRILQYSYMIRAMLVGGIVSVIVPMIGLVVVNKRAAMIGDALSHVSLAGVMIGLILGFNPIVGAICICIVAGLGLDFFNKRFSGYEEVSTAIVMSSGIGLASILSGFVKGSANLESFLFGSIIAISDFELWMILSIAAVVIFLMWRYYYSLLHICFDEVSAELLGISAQSMNRIFMILTATTIALSARTVGVLIISSLMVLPVTCAMRCRCSYHKTLILAICFALFFTLGGLVLAFYLGLKPGGTIVMLGVLTLISLIIVKK